MNEALTSRLSLSALTSCQLKATETAKQIEGMPMAPKHGSEGYVGIGTTLAMRWGWSPYADFTKTFTKGYRGRFSQKF
jgi:hypothetical protein